MFRTLLLIIVFSLMTFPSWSKDSVPHGQFLGAKETVYPGWFKQSFLDFAEDVAEAAEQGRRVMMIFHQDNCPYCNVLVERNLAQKDIEQTLKENFDVIAINMWGDREVATVDGEALIEKSLAATLRVQFTPTIIVLNEQGGLALRLNGYIPPAQFKLALEYAKTHDSPDEYQKFLAANGAPSSDGELVASDLFNNQPLSLPTKHEKPVALFFEQRDCPACQTLHETALADAETKPLLDGFDRYRVDMWSDSDKVKLDGKQLTARELAGRMKVKYAPTMVLFDASGKEVIRSEAMFKTFHTQSMLDYVLSSAYAQEPSFQRYLSERAEAIRATGKDVDIWK